MTAGPESGTLMSRTLPDTSSRTPGASAAGGLPMNPAEALGQTLDALLVAMEDAVVGCDADGRITRWNAAAQRLFGHAAAEALGRPIGFLGPAPCPQPEADGQRAPHAEPDPMRCGATLRHRDGQPLPLAMSRTLLRDPQGRVAGSLSVYRDERPRIEAARQAQHHASLVASSDDAIITRSLDGRVSSWNPGAERIFGWTAAEIIGRPITDLMPPERHAEEAEIQAEIARGRKVEHFETERLRKDGSTVLVSVTTSPLLDERGCVVGASKIARDIGLRVQAERVIQHHATTDAMTGVLNRRAFGERLRHALQDAALRQAKVGLLLIDLDHFKRVNDTVGHRTGDRLLRQVAQRLRQVVRQHDVLARLGGDQFTVLLTAIDIDEEVLAEGQRISNELALPFTGEGGTLRIGGSIGVAVFPADGQTDALLLQQAEEAMFACKRAGGARAMRLSPAQQRAALDRTRLMADLHQALPLGQLSLVYQPVADLRSGRVCKAEALVRWTHPALGPINPGAFIPLAEEAGLLRQIGDWVFREAARQAALWRPHLGDALQISVNLSPSQLLAGPHYFAGWARHLQGLGLPGSALILEITEGMVVDGSAETHELLQHIRESGAEIAVDDFGTGYSTLSSLSRMDVQYLKIDQSFVRAMAHGARDVALCRAITAMAHSLGLKVVAEGIETPEQARLLAEMGCDFGQGWHFGRPAPAALVEPLLCRSALPIACTPCHADQAADPGLVQRIGGPTVA